MSDQISTIVIKVDLGCEKCYNKIRKVLCKYHCQIQSKTFDKKNNIVTVTGWFHPCEFSKKLRCKAGKAIISIEIIEKKVPQPEPEKTPAPAPHPDPPAQAPESKPSPPPEPIKQDPPPEPEPTPAPTPAPEEPEPHKIIVPYFVPGYPPWYEGYGEAPCYEGYGMPVVPVPPPYQFPPKPPIYREPAPPPDYDCYYGGPPPCSCGCGGYRRCATPGNYFTEENPSTCSIM